MQSPRGIIRGVGGETRQGKVAHAHQGRGIPSPVSAYEEVQTRGKCQVYDSIPSAHSIHPVSEMYLKAFYFPLAELA